jgi:nucleoside-diphosphate-sugar epimerase
MKYFITGATGFIGGCVARQVVQAGHQVVALVRSTSKAHELERFGVQLAEGDITDKESMRKPMTGVDGVFQVAGWYKVGAKNNSMAEAINVVGTRNVLEMMRELKIPKGVYTSTVAVFSHTHRHIVDESYHYDGPHVSKYDETKWRAHYEVAEPMQKAGLPLVIVQPGLVYGPGDTSSVAQNLRQYLLGRLPIAPKQTAFCWAHVDDVARGHILAMEKGRAGESYIICGQPMSFVGALALCERITGRKAPRVHLEPGIMDVMSKIMGFAGRVISLPESYTEESLRVVAGTTYLASDAKARRELGFSTRPLEEGLRETLRYEMEQLGMPVG